MWVLGGQTFTVESRPYALYAAFDDAFLADIEAAETQFDVHAVYRRRLGEILAGWNVTDDADAPLPLNLGLIPGRALIAWYRTILEHGSPDLGTARVSSAGCTLEAQRVASTQGGRVWQGREVREA